MNTHNANWSLGPRLRSAVLGASLALFVAAPVTADVNVADSPLFVSTNVEPNILFLLDDSGSMQWETMPDELTQRFATGCCPNHLMWVFPRINNLHGGGDYGNVPIPRFQGNLAAMTRSSHVNTVFYNPAITYQPWPNADGTPMPPANPAAAPNRPLFPGLGTRDLTTEATHNSWRNDDGSPSGAAQTYFPAVYYHYDGGNEELETSYTRVEIRPVNAPFTDHGRENRSDCALAAATPPSCTYDEEIQNFANWYTYHRNRVFTSRAGIGSAFVEFDGGMRVGYGTINHGRTSLQTVDGVAGRSVIRGMRSFSGADRDQFFDLLYEGAIPPQGTPLRRALEGAGEYFSRTDERGPWSDTPGTTGGGDLACRQSFTILMTDGYTSGGSGWDATNAARRANNDGGTAHATLNLNPSGPNYQYVPADPFRDSRDNTLADVSMYYWKRDLRPDLVNRVPISERNPAFWQHMVTYVVGLGVTGSIDPEDAFAAIGTGTPIAWPNPQLGTTNCTGAACQARLDDALHAAVNARGGFFSAQDPDTFARELGAVLEDIVARVESSATAAATSSAVLQTDTLLYTAGFRSGDWSGQLIGREVNADGTVGSLVWDAEALLAVRTPASRNLFTRSGAGTLVPLEFSTLSVTQQSALDKDANEVTDNRGVDRIAWLRGEEAFVDFRSRSESVVPRLLGDIINSNPQYAGKTDFGYQLLPGGEGSSYGAFRASTAYANRPDVIYVGANSGLLHAFNAETGEEMFAYMPSELLSPEPGRDHAPVSRLMEQDYTHRYFMDGTPTIRDAYISGQWRTVLVSSMGAGGRTVFALDVTDPSSPSLLWEFTHAELGTKVGQPSIVRLRDGNWGAVFGNGYNSASHTAALFIVNLETGDLIQRIDTGIGSAGDPNGMASPAITDFPAGDLRAALAYAGDLLGNLWRIDLSSSSPTDWATAAARTVLFTATDDADDPQPITARPALALLPGNLDTVVVSFGTGSYFRQEDAAVSGVQTQSIYGVFDRGAGTTFDRDNLLEQTIENQETRSFTTPTGPREFALREVSDNELDLATHQGWYLDLEYGGSNQAERVISQGTFPSGRTAERVRFTTLIPDDDPCGTGRRGYLMDIDLFSGGRFDAPVFDLTGDGVLDDLDLADGIPPSGVGFGSGELPTTIRRRDQNLEGIYTGDGENIDGRTGDILEGRQSWRQLQ